MVWKDLSYIKKGLTIGLIFAVILSIIAVMGIYTCRWNPIEGSVIPSGMCKLTQMIFYLPFVPAHLAGLIMTSALIEPSEETFWIILTINSVIINLLFFSLLGILVGWIISKFRKQ